MNTSTNMLYGSKEAAIKAGEKLKDITNIPDRLNRAARRKLEGKNSVKVSFNSGSLLSRFAAKIRLRKQNKQ